MFLTLLLTLLQFANWSGTSPPASIMPLCSAAAAAIRAPLPLRRRGDFVGDCGTSWAAISTVRSSCNCRGAHKGALQWQVTQDRECGLGQLVTLTTFPAGTSGPFLDRKCRAPVLPTELPTSSPLQPRCMSSISQIPNAVQCVSSMSVLLQQRRMLRCATCHKRWTRAACQNRVSCLQEPCSSLFLNPSSAFELRERMRIVRSLDTSRLGRRWHHSSVATLNVSLDLLHSSLSRSGHPRL